MWCLITGASLKTKRSRNAWKSIISGYAYECVSRKEKLPLQSIDQARKSHLFSMQWTPSKPCKIWNETESIEKVIISFFHSLIPPPSSPHLLIPSLSFFSLFFLLPQSSPDLQHQCLRFSSLQIWDLHN